MLCIVTSPLTFCFYLVFPQTPVTETVTYGMMVFRVMNTKFYLLIKISTENRKTRDELKCIWLSSSKAKVHVFIFSMS